MNALGHILQLQTFGESHGPAIGGIISGFPAGVIIDLDAVQAALNRRRPGQSAITTQRNEADAVTFLSGIYQGKTTGTPIGFTIANTNQQSDDYEAISAVFRPSHADFTYTQKYGHVDRRGGGRSSARETANWVVAGALAQQLLQHVGIRVWAYVHQVGSLITPHAYTHYQPEWIERSPVRCPDTDTAARIEALILQTKAEGDSLGGIIQGVAQGVPAGWGQPVFNKLHADLGKAMLSINAVKGFEYGLGFSGIHQKGSEVNDEFIREGAHIKTTTNHSGGIQGGISNGMDIHFKVAFKPTATILQAQQTVNLAGEAAVLTAQGRHDPCVLPRAVPIVEALTNWVLADHYVWSKTQQI